MKNILILGATSAIAQSCARLWAAEGARFLLVARSEAKLEAVASDLRARGAVEVLSRAQDLGDLASHAALVAGAFDALGSVDIALIAYGTLPDQQRCEQDTIYALAEFTTNGLSVIGLLNELANRFAHQAAGTIAVISSVAGDRGRASNYLYGSAKAAVSTYCSGLRGRLFPSGVNVLLVKPGFVATPMTAGLPLPGPLVASPSRVARDIHRAIEAGKAVLYTPWFWRLIMLILLHVPTAVFKRLKF